MTLTKTSAALLLGGVLLAAPVLSWAKDLGAKDLGAKDVGAETGGGSVGDRLVRVEDEAATLARAMGAAPILVASSDGLSSSVAADFEVRLQRLERAISDLTGKADENAYQMSQLKDRLERVNGDIDFRLQQIEGGKGGGSAKAPPPAAHEAPGRPSPAAPTPAAAVASPPSDRGGPIASPPAGASPEKQYEYAFELLRHSDYDKAEKAFSDFIAKNKNSSLAPNAQYWLGEMHFTRNQFMEAAAAFSEGYQKYPKSNKAGDSLLGLGRSMSQLHKKNEACVAFNAILQKLPDAPAATKRRAEAEKRKLSCPG